jgi:excisionase family DNA binding protein
VSTLIQPLAYTIRECAEALRISERTVRRAIATGKLRAIRVGRLVRVPAASLRQFVERGGQARQEELAEAGLSQLEDSHG